MKYRVPVGDITLTEAHKYAVNAILDGGMLTPGRWCEKFQDQFARRHGAAHGLFVNSGTDALRLAVLALKEKHQWPDGSGVIIPASTFVATANVVRQAGLTPIIVDVSMYDSLINPWAIVRLFECMADMSGVKAIMPVHLFGKVCDMDHLTKLAKTFNLKIIEDSCESAGVSKIRGDVACYSTYACHVMSTGVGGLALTNDSKLNDLMWSYANHGRKKTKDPKDRFTFERPGYSSRATEMQAALGMVELQNLDENLARRKEIAGMLRMGLDGNRAFQLMSPGLEDAHMMYPLVVRKGRKNRLCRQLEAKSIETRDWISLVDQVDYDTTHLSVSRDFKKNGFYVGCHPGMSNEDVDYVVKTLRKLTN